MLRRRVPLFCWELYFVEKWMLLLARVHIVSHSFKKFDL